jgi:hypothetical protein
VTCASADTCPTCGAPLYGEPACSWCASVRAHEAAMARLTDPSGPLTVKLASAGNIDFGQDHRRSLPGVPRLTVRVATLRAASLACREYIRHHELGGGNWIGGEVRRGKKLIAKISYNGRAWHPTERLVEIPLEGAAS